MSGDRVVAVVEARMGSTRLPGKSLKPLAGVPLVERVVRRVERAKSLDGVVVATSTAAVDDRLAAHLERAGFAVFRGSEDDVLARILGAAHAQRAAIHVQCWGDCPFVDPDQIDSVVSVLRNGSADLVSNCVGGRQVPHGLEVIAFRVEALERAERDTRGHAYHREHGTTYLYETAGAFSVERVDTPDALRRPDLDLTINTVADYDAIVAIYEVLLETRPDFRLVDVLELVRARPALFENRKMKVESAR